MAYEVEVTPEGLRHLNRIPAKVRDAVIEVIYGTIAEDPHRAGKPLRGELEGLRSARRGDFRIIYEVDDEAQMVLIHRTVHRATAYRRGREGSIPGARQGSVNETAGRI